MRFELNDDNLKYLAFKKGVEFNITFNITNVERYKFCISNVLTKVDHTYPIAKVEIFNKRANEVMTGSSIASITVP